MRSGSPGTRWRLSARWCHLVGSLAPLVIHEDPPAAPSCSIVTLLHPSRPTAVQGSQPSVSCIPSLSLFCGFWTRPAPHAVQSRVSNLSCLSHLPSGRPCTHTLVGRAPMLQGHSQTLLEHRYTVSGQSLHRPHHCFSVGWSRVLTQRPQPAASTPVPPPQLGTRPTLLQNTRLPARPSSPPHQTVPAWRPRHARLSTGTPT